MPDSQACRLLDEATHDLLAWAREVRESAPTPLAAARRLVTRLGAHYRDGRAEVGFWAPELVGEGVDDEEVYLEVLTPLEPIDFDAEEQQIRFRRELVPLVADGEYRWAVVDGMRAGTREEVGSFYRLRYEDDEGGAHFLLDPLAASVPFGAFAPAELYDVEGMQARREDQEHFRDLDTQPDPDGVPRVQAPTNILQIHVNTASAGGTLKSLAELYRSIAAKVEAGEVLSPAEENYVGYDAVQLMPIEPIIEYEAGPPHWEWVEEDGDEVTALLRRFEVTNWGYDVVIAASPAVNPGVLATNRPDELVDFIATLHNFPGKPIGVIFDIVYGHTDNQALPLLGEHFIAGPGMYGQELNFRHPTVRAMLLEMQQRKSDYGVDGVRVDGAQDFKYWDAEARELKHDDDYLTLMNDVEQRVAGVRYRPWMIFEDGRPWPRADWELASTYREVTKQHENVVQWGPLTFAHNTPFLFTFWISKWWRIQEIAQFGSHWITGTANHDTLRRGTQVDPGARINTYLGDTLPEIFRKAYDNPVTKLFDYVLMPGVPMDFINASMRAPWGFIRNTDDRYGVKVVSEEAHLLDWAMTEERFSRPETFPRLKGMGFEALAELRRFMHVLDHTVQLTDYDVEAMVPVLNSVEPALAGGPFSVARLKAIARAWMDDVHEYGNVSLYAAGVGAEQARFTRAVREFRRARPWLVENLRVDEHFDRVAPSDGAVLFFGLRRAPDGSEELLCLMNMEGAPRVVVPTALPVPRLAQQGWEVALNVPGMQGDLRPDRPLTLRDSEGVVYVRRP
jgi:hypothetical protein